MTEQTLRFTRGAAAAAALWLAAHSAAGQSSEGLGMAEPARERLAERRMVPCRDIEIGRRPRPAVQILVAAADCEIDPGDTEIDRQRAGGMGEIPQHQRTLGLRRTGGRRHVVHSAFDGRRVVIFSGGAKSDEKSFFEEVRAIRDGGGFGSIIGRNSFQRPKADAIKFLQTVMGIYAGDIP